MNVGDDPQRIVRQLFSLPETEDVLDDFSCALKRKINMHGRLFCTDHNLCFYANVLGIKINLTVKFSEIRRIEKRAKAIYVVCGNEKVYIFSSFVSSSQALKFLTDLWRASGYAPDSELPDSSTSHTDSSDTDTTMATEEKDETAVLLPDDQGSVLETVKLIIALSPEQFFNRYLSDAAGFSMREFWLAEGHTDISLTDWCADEETSGYTREGKYRMLAPMSSRVQAAHLYSMQPSKLSFRASVKYLDGSGARFYQVEHEWVVSELSPDKSILRLNATIRFLTSTSKKAAIETKVFPELKREDEQWVSRAALPKVLPETEKAKEQPALQLTRHEDVDLALFTKTRQVEKVAESSVLLYVNVGGVMVIVLYLAYLHWKLWGHYREVICG